MSVKDFFYNYGEVVPGYDVRVINDREARAAAGILFMFGMITIFVGIGYNHIIVARVYLGFLWFDFLIKLINPKYSPSALLGKLFVFNQTPEYVGAAQKRFAWFIGWLISLPMMEWFVLHWDITFYKVLICILCLTLMLLESAFSICVGCIIYKLFTRKDPQYCPGGVCEIHKKEPTQIFSVTQKIITGISLIAITVGLYLFLAKTESKTFFGQFLHEAVLTKTQLKAEEDKKFQEESDKEFGDDDF